MHRSLAAGLLAVLAVVGLGPSGLLVAWASGSARPLYVLARWALGALMAVAGVRLVVTGRERLDPDTAYMFVGNHVSNLDPPAAFLAIDRDVRALAKAELFRIPLFGAVLRAAGFPAVERRDRVRAVATLTAAASGLAGGSDFLAFPEGTRSADGRLGTFKKGPFVMALQAHAPVAPFVVHGTADVWPKGSLRVRSGSVRVEFLPPVSTSALTVEDRDQLRQRVREMMAGALAGPEAVPD